MTTFEAARELGVTERAVRQMCRAGRLSAVKVGADWLVQIEKGGRGGGDTVRKNENTEMGE